MKKLIITGFLFGTVAILYCCVAKKQKATVHTYAGTEKCQSCHKKEFELFKTSDHYHAMYN